MKIESTGRLLDYRYFRKYSTIWIESGCAAGDGVQRACDAGFLAVYSIEAAEVWYKQSHERFLNNERVNIIFGSTLDVLPELCEVFENAKCIFYLDAHSSGESSFGHKECVSGDPEFQQENIIKKEMEIILSKKNDSIIIIDDVNGLADGHAIEYAELISSFNPEYKFYFYDENLSGEKEFYYTDKLLVAIPN